MLPGVLSFWYLSEDVFWSGFGWTISSAPSMAKLSFAISCKGLPLDFFCAGAFLGLAEGGVFESRESSLKEPGPSLMLFSSSDLLRAGFLEGLAGLRVVFVVFFGAALGFGAALVEAVVFLVGAFAFYGCISFAK